MRRQHSLLPAALIVATVWLASCARDEATAPLPDVPAPSGDVADQQDLIPGQYIVVFKDDVGNPVRLANDLVAAHGLTLRHTYQHAIKGFSAKFPEAAEGVILQALQRNPNVSYVEQNRYWYIDTHEVLRRRAVAAYAASLAAAPFRPPSNLAATAVSETEINVTWTETNSDEAGHELHRANSPSGTFTMIADLGPNVTQYPDTDVLPSTQYCYKVRAYKTNKKGNKRYTGFSNTDCDTTPGPPTAPNPPSNLIANAVSSSQIDLTWNDNSTDEDNFELERCAGADCSNFANIADPPANATSYNDTGLSANTVYRYRIRACNAVGCSGYSNVAEDQTPAPPQPPDGDPTSLVATGASSSQIDLTWNDNASNEDGYEIWECQGTAAACDDTGLSNYDNVDQTGPNANSYSRTGRAANTTYSYLVRAFNSAGVSGFSNEDDATTMEAGACDDKGVHDDLSDPGLYGITKTKANQNSHWQGVRGNGAECGMKAEFFGLDTGVDSDHLDLNVVEIRCFLAGSPSCTGEDDHGHGSHTAGTAAAIDGGPSNGVVGMAPGAKIHGYKVCNSGGSCPNDDIIAGIDAVTAYKNANPSVPMVANMSLGGGISNPIDTAVRRSVNAGVTYTLSAGNGVFGICFFPGDAQNASPARVGDDDINASNGSNGDTKRVNGAITTTSSNQNDTDVNCNFGNPVTVAAPGSGIKSTWLNGGYNTISGTSMAAPHSAGAAILVLQGNQGLTPTQIEQQIVADLDPWTTDDLPNADGRLDARCLGTGDTSCAGSN